jgi:hypothetical protein
MRSPLDNKPPVLVSASSNTHASCADTDGDGNAGVVSLGSDFRHPRTGEIVPVVFVPTTGDIDSPGIYDFAATIGNDTLVFSAKVNYRIPGFDR